MGVLRALCGFDFLSPAFKFKLPRSSCCLCSHLPVGLRIQNLLKFAYNTVVAASAAKVKHIVVLTTASPPDTFFG